MKKIIKAIAEIAVCALLGIIASAVILAALTFFVAMPDILNWVASYIGGFLTYSLYIIGIGGFIYWCLSRK
jgi:hypothetical protein